MNFDRRSFLKQGVSIAATAAPWLTQLAAIAEASAQTAGDDYKALVCIFLSGGNDQSNTLIPLGTTQFQAYQSARPDFFVNKDSITYGSTNRPIASVPIPKQGPQYPGLTYDFPDLASSAALTLQTLNTVAQGNIAAGGQYGLAPSLAALMPLYQAKVLAPVLNVGPLIEPTIGLKMIGASQDDPVMLRKRLAPELNASLPPKLESHNDQQMYWQALTTEGAQEGWGGLILDRLQDLNPDRRLESLYTVGGSVWQQGDNIPYQISQGLSLAAKFDVYDQGYRGVDLKDAIKQLMTGALYNDVSVQEPFTWFRTHHLRRDLMSMAREGFEIRGTLDEATHRIEGDPVYAGLSALISPPGNVLPNERNLLASQLRAVAHAIRTSRQLPDAPKRQVFFVSLSGFDTHNNTSGVHDVLLQHLAQAMLGFYRTLEALGVTNNVTTFTASDFGRTLGGNGDGSDHGWGGHHFVMGGAVKGGAVYGVPPPLGDKALIGPSSIAGHTVHADRGRGRLIPTISVDQYGATFARWMGISDADMPTIFKNIGNFGASIPYTQIRLAWPATIGFL